jgi:ABC-type xylose transport system permease subunit
MILSTNPLERRLQVSGVLLILGLVVEAVCLFWTRPIAFVLFLGLGGLLLFLGIVVYLYPLISVRPTQR